MRKIFQRKWTYERLADKLGKYVLNPKNILPVADGLCICTEDEQLGTVWLAKDGKSAGITFTAQANPVYVAYLAHGVGQLLPVQFEVTTPFESLLQNSINGTPITLH